ncbi:MAG: hypothetical protein WCW03_02980 [Candidatus Paceibacterota bacterium]|jgi:hypothetical protein
MKTFLSLRQNKTAFVLSIVVSVFFVVSVASAVTTISTNISTAGNITTTDGGTLTVSGLATLGNASTTLLSVGGSTGTTMSQILKGTCNLSTTVLNLPLATSTKPFQCSVANVASGDLVFVTLPSDGGSLGGTPGLIMTYAKASSTATYIEVGLAIPFGSDSSVATSSFALATTSVSYFIVR